MKGHPWLSFVILVVVCVVVGSAGAVTPVVKSTCMISWDPSGDHPGITEYRITVWMVNGRTPQKTTHVVKAPTTQVSCKEVGANKSGNWQATVQACLNDGICSEASKPLSFKVAEK
jgi:NMD protein affecting ribosome stability and mRNA decay